MGGLEKKLYDLVDRIDRDHYRVVICCLKEGGHFKDAFVELGVPFYEGLLKSKFDVFAYRRLLRILQKENVDLIYTLPHPNSMIFSAMARWSGRVKATVVSIHGTGGPMGGKMVRGYLKPIFGGIDRFIAVANEHKEYLVESEGLDESKIVVIHNGVDVDRYHPGPADETLRDVFGIDRGEKVVVTVASLNPYKGIDVFIRSAAEVLRTAPETRFLIVGDGPERPSLESFVTDLGIAERVIFTGIRSDVDAILRLGDVFALSSRTEAFPNVILEAFATGLPVIATDVGSVGELVFDNKTGVKIPVDDPAALTGAVVDLLGDGEKAARWGANARKLVEKEFRIEGMCDKRERLFGELLCGDG
jgi:glycosyltransferase involved in cell wall biosynthesis